MHMLKLANSCLVFAFLIVCGCSRPAPVPGSAPGVPVTPTASGLEEIKSVETSAKLAELGLTVARWERHAAAASSAASSGNAKEFCFVYIGARSPPINDLQIHASVYDKAGIRLDETLAIEDNKTLVDDNRISIRSGETIKLRIWSPAGMAKASRIVLRKAGE
jgi:hypothetical protein